MVSQLRGNTRLTEQVRLPSFQIEVVEKPKVERSILLSCGPTPNAPRLVRLSDRMAGQQNGRGAKTRKLARQ
jgi:hypothetical protein